MANLLFLAHRIPYPPNKGDKIRSYHLLRHLAARHRVFLGCFVDDAEDLQHVSVLRSLCADVQAVQIGARGRRIGSLSGLVRGEPLSLPYYRDAGMQQWVDGLLKRESLDGVVVFSSSMAQYVSAARWSSLARVADFVDVDSEKWRQYAARARAPLSWLYTREGDRLLDFERRIAAEFDATLFVSDAEAALFRRLAPECASTVSSFSNGVDTDYFDPSRDQPGVGEPSDDPYGEGGPVVVFTGAMDYWPNVEAVNWFARGVLPLIRRLRPDTRFAIVGLNPAPEVKQLQALEGVVVTGRVPDMRPYLRHAQVVVAPLRIARGIQNKVLEALAMARPVVCTSAAAEGIDDYPGLRAAIADDSAAFARAVVERLERGQVDEHRQFVLERYGWDRCLRRFDNVLEHCLAAHHTAALHAQPQAVA